MLILIRHDILAASMNHQSEKSLTAIQIWWLAIRPKTLPVSIAGVITGWSVALLDGNFSTLPAITCLFVALLLQIASNLANDVFDYERGTDTSERVGPMRVTQARLLTPFQVKTGLYIAIGLASILGLYLTLTAGWLILIIGIAAIAASVLYTGGPYPLGYHGFGDLFVFLFFGLAAVTGTYYVQAQTVSTAAWWMAIPTGLLVVNLLVVNNLRDIRTDLKAGKYTLAVRMGERPTRINYILWLSIAYALIPILAAFKVIPWISLITWLSLPCAISTLWIVLTKTGRELNPGLAGTSQLALLFSLLFIAAMLIHRLFF